MNSGKNVMNAMNFKLWKNEKNQILVEFEALVSGKKLNLTRNLQKRPVSEWELGAKKSNFKAYFEEKKRDPL